MRDPRMPLGLLWLLVPVPLCGPCAWRGVAGGDRRFRTGLRVACLYKCPGRGSPIPPRSWEGSPAGAWLDETWSTSDLSLRGRLARTVLDYKRQNVRDRRCLPG